MKLVNGFDSIVQFYGCSKYNNIQYVVLVVTTIVDVVRVVTKW